ncbi:hypothetical protein CIHG_07573 [Coccidioides immitis H538.4]|uniref:Uncharacterized protein n=1 Tax=Coccidioides immitis H538.4 TaxID=396776 RepID=A0A0J8RXK9_COCIT|nr:hypothetical protein CIHG_07573 [Coccidioides immitis H538.4]
MEAESTTPRKEPAADNTNNVIPVQNMADSSLAAMTRDGPVKHSLPTGEVSTDTGQPQDTDKSPQSVPAKPPTIENKAQPARTAGTRGSDKDDQTSRPPQAENDSHNACQRQNSHLNPTDRYRPNPAPLPTSTSTKPHSTQSPPPPPPPPPKSQPHMSIPPSIPQAERHNLEHPPGYIQNSAAISLPPPPPPQPPTPSSTGHWYWSDAPNLSGGRYVYSASCSPAPVPSPYPGTSAETSLASRAAHRYDLSENDQFGNGGAGYDDSGWGAGNAGYEWGEWAWEGAKNWGRAMGNRLAEAEEGVWRWVNRKV